MREHDARRITDIACGTGILTSRIQSELPSATVFGVASVATICPKERGWMRNRTGERGPTHVPTAGEMGRLFAGAGFDVVAHRPVARPVTPPLVSVDWICVGLKT
ncbi:trans-aconitate methyltransferase [Mycobacteroides chelonae]|nr:trans-aconitate methyltransferase [Mycobacteroides chelonae]